MYQSIDKIILNENMSYKYETIPNEDLDSDKLPITGRLTPIGSASSDTEYDRRYF